MSFKLNYEDKIPKFEDKYNNAFSVVISIELDANILPTIDDQAKLNEAIASIVDTMNSYRQKIDFVDAKGPVGSESSAEQ